MMDRLREHIAQWNPDEVEKSAHKLKGSSLNLGADQLAQMLNEMEQIGRENDRSGSQELLSRIDAEFREITRELQALVDENP